jgi:chromosome segregation ATPase
MTNANIQQLRVKADEAKAHEQALFTEADALPGRIAQAAREDVQAKAQAAREGGAVTATASETQALQERMSALRYELWATRLYAAEAAAQLHAEEETSARAEEPAALRALKDATAKLEAAQAEHVRATGAAGGPDRKASHARRQRLEAERRIKDLEARYPLDA